MKKTNTILLLVLFALVFLISFIIDDFVINLFSEMELLSSFTNFVSIFILFVLATLYFYVSKKKKWIVPLWFSFVFSVFVSFILKLIVARPRINSEIIYALFNTLNYSFPSMHAMVAFAAVPILNKSFPKFMWIWFALGFLICFNRVYFGFHYFSDVVFGAFLGYLIGLFIVYHQKKFDFLK